MPVLPKPAKRGVFGKNAILEMSLKLGVPGETAQHVSKIWGSGVQNGFCCSVVRLGRWIRNHPLREGTTPEHVSKIWGSGVQNGFCYSVVRLGRWSPATADQLTKILTRCRKCCLKILLKIKTVVLNGSPKSRRCWTLFNFFLLKHCPGCPK